MKRILVGLVVFVTFLSIFGCGNVDIAKDDQKLNVVATIFPLADMAANIGGDLVISETLIPPGYSPHIYEPKPSDVTKLAEADLVLMIGFGLDDWAKKMMIEAGLESDKIVDLSDEVDLSGINLIDNESGGKDPHYWVSPKRVLSFVDDIRDILVQMDGENTDQYMDNYDVYYSELIGLDNLYAEKINGFSKKDIITFHEAFSYLAHDYGLNIAGVIEPITGSEPTPQQLQDIVDQIRKMEVKAIFAEPQLSDQVVDAIKDDIGIELGILDPLGGVENKESYIETMEANLSELGKYLK